MSKIEQADRVTFSRTVTVEYDPDEAPEYVDRYSRDGRKGRASRVRINYDYQFRSGIWTDNATVYWRWVLKSGELGEQERRDTFANAPWVRDLIEQHRPTSSIEIKENN